MQKFFFLQRYPFEFYTVYTGNRSKMNQDTLHKESLLHLVIFERVEFFKFLFLTSKKNHLN